MKQVQSTNLAQTPKPGIVRRILLWLHHLKQRMTGEDLTRELRDLSTNADFTSAIEDARQSTRATGGIPHDQFWSELESEQVSNKK